MKRNEHIRRNHTSHIMYTPPAASHKNGDISSIRQLSKNKANLIIDLRRASVFRTVHIEGTINIPYEQYKTDITRIAPNKLTPIYLLCTTGEKSREAAEYLVQRGWRDVTNLGAISGWKYGFVSNSGKWIRCSEDS